MDYTLVADLLALPKVQETHMQLHHSIPKYDHLVRSAQMCYRIAPWLKADRRICTRAAILHDIDSRHGTLRTHGAIAARYAATIGECERVCCAIETHMYPLCPKPTSREGWVLVIADKLAAVSDMTQFLRGLLSGRSIKERRRLLRSDPYYASRTLKTRLKRILIKSKTFVRAGN